MSSVEDLGLALQRFGWPDYLVFSAMMLCSAGIGVYFGFCVGTVSPGEYLLGGRNMRTFPVAMSLIASYVSGITLLGTPTEVYVYGTQYLYIIFAIVLMGAVMAYAFLPVFHELQVTSTYEYLERRFDKRVRLLGSVLFLIANIVWLSLVVYLPALALNQVTGIRVHVITPVVTVVCIFYTCVGGLQAVIWTDVLQTAVMFGSLVLVVVKGTFDVGGVREVWERNRDSGRLEAPNFSLDPYERHTFWVLLIGGFALWLQTNSSNHVQVQRYLALPSLKAAQNATWIFVVGVIAIIYLCGYAGLLTFAKYHTCDPLTTKLAMAKDQLLPLLVMDVLGDYPGIPGMFVAGVFSAAFSSLSTGLNSIAAVVWEDFFKTFTKRELTDRQAAILMKSTVVLIGALCVALVFVVEKLGTVVLQISVSVCGVAFTPSLGLFCMGLFLPWVNSIGALVGGVVGLVFMTWISIGTEFAIATGLISFQTKPVSVEMCSYNFTLPAASNVTSAHNDVFAMYRISYLWYPLIGTCVTVLVGLLVSLAVGATNLHTINPAVVSPLIRRWLPKKKPIPEQMVSLLELRPC